MKRSDIWGIIYVHLFDDNFEKNLVPLSSYWLKIMNII